MVKKRNGVVEPTASTPVQTRESLQRISYLVQASVLLRSLVDPHPVAPEQARTDRQTGSNAATGGLSAGKAAAAEHAPSSLTTRTQSTTNAADPTRSDKQAGHKRRKMSSRAALAPISDHLAGQMTAVAKKATVRIDPALKRVVCKCCDAALIPGLTSTVRVKPSKAHAHLLVYTCTGCHTQRRIPATPHSEEASTTAPDADQTAKLETEAGLDSAKTLTKRERREKRQARPPVFFEREDHVVVRGSAVLSRDEYRQPAE
ncbi:hypothetical protein JCM3774_004422 [Rhodotorula dairenensis]